MKDKELIEKAMELAKQLDLARSRRHADTILRLVKRVEKLQPEPKSIVWEPEKGERYYLVLGNGEVYTNNWQNSEEDRGRLKNHNVYKTREQAEKAAKYQRRYNMVLQAVLNLEPDQKVDWKDMDQVKHVVEFDPNEGVYYHSVGSSLVDNLYPVLTDEKNVQPLLDYLNFKEKSDEIRHQC